MSPLRLIILLVAAGAAIAAVFVVRTMQAPAQAVAAVPIEAPKPVEAPTIDVLVVKRSVSLGQFLSPDDLAWQPWPMNAPVTNFFTKKDNADALEKSVGAVARVDMVEGEPIVASKIVHVGDSGFMSAVLRPGMRAVSIEISAEAAAGGFILPGDHVDVMMTRELEAGETGGAPGKNIMTKGVLSNVRILAIDGVYGQAREGQGQFLVGSRATLELSPDDSKLLVTAQKAGQLSLTLRSVADLKAPSGAASGASGVGGGSEQQNQIRVYRYGQPGLAAAPAG